MFKVMIVDDEPMIRQGLQSLIEWDHYQFDVCATASNGLEALELYKQHQPDLVLIDIRMPIMDGLKTIQGLRNLGAECKILILSGYGEFQYAQQAIKYRIDGYILKPIDEEELSEFVAKISKDLQSRQREQSLSSQSAELIKEEWLKSFVAQELLADEISAEQWQLLFSSEPKQLRLLLVETYSRDHSLTIRKEVMQAIAKFVKQHSWGEVFFSEAYIAVLLHDLEMSQFKRERLEEVFVQCCGSNVYYVALMSHEFEAPQDLYSQIPMMKQYLHQRFFLQENKLYTIDGIKDALHRPDLSKDLPAFEVEHAAKRILYSIDVGNKQQLAGVIEEVDGQLRAGGLTEQQVKSNWAQLLTIVMNRLSSLYPKEQFEKELKIVTGLYLAFNNHRMLEQLLEKLHCIIDSLGLKDTSNTTVIKQMIDFIDRHYMEPLRLESLAEVFNYNSGYLGKLFKNHTGDSFNTYLDRIRIEQAIIGLQEGKKVHQVAEIVGYANVDYFHSKFKKYKGVSPSAFKASASLKGPEQEDNV